MRENINNLMSEVLSEEFKKKSKEIGEKLVGKQKKLDVATPKGKLTAADFIKLRKKGKKSDEVGEGNAFTKELAKARKLGKSSFTLNGKKYAVKESDNQKVLRLTEDDLVNLIEDVILQVENTNISKKTHPGLSRTQNVLKKNKSENEDYLKSVTQKMNNYVKSGSEGKYTTNPKDFPMQNGQLKGKNERKGYTASDAVDEYVEYFAYPGQTNLMYNEIKPDNNKIKKYLKGDSTTGNSQKYANAVETNVGDKFYKNYDENVYGAEQASASYKKEPQPIDVAGDVRQPGGLLKKRGSLAKSKKVLTQLEQFMRDRQNKI